MREWYNLLIMEGMMDNLWAQWIIKGTMDKSGESGECIIIYIGGHYG